MNNQESTIKDIFEIVEFIRDNAATKDDIQKLENKISSVEQRLEGKIDSVKNEMIEHVDGFVKLYQKHEVELAAVVSRQNRVEERLEAVIKHLGLELA